MIAKLRRRRSFKIIGMNSIATNRHDVAQAAGRLLDRFGHGPLTVLDVWAHPDDESFLAGGLLAEVARRGGRVVTVVATAGEHGTDDPVAEPPAELARRRVAELDDAMAALGAEPAIHLGYRDGACHEVTEHLAAHLIGRIVDDVQPDLIVTFGPDGVTGHPDHQAVSRWVRRAVADRGDDTPLLTTAAADAWPHESVEGLHSIDAFWPGYPVAHPDGDRLVVRLDPDQLDSKLAALSCHASQMRTVATALGVARFVDLAAVECFTAANAAARRRVEHHQPQELTSTSA